MKILIMLILMCKIVSTDVYSRNFESIQRVQYYNAYNPMIDVASGHYNIDVELARYIHDVCDELDIDYFTFCELIQVECEFRPRRSATGAIGYCQLTTIAIRDIERIYGYTGLDVHNPKDNIMLGAMYYKALITHYRKSEYNALVYYNAGGCLVLRPRGINYANKIIRNRIKEIIKWKN